MDSQILDIPRSLYTIYQIFPFIFHLLFLLVAEHVRLTMELQAQIAAPQAEKAAAMAMARCSEDYDLASIQKKDLEEAHFTRALREFLVDHEFESDRAALNPKP